MFKRGKTKDARIDHRIEADHNYNVNLKKILSESLILISRLKNQLHLMQPNAHKTVNIIFEVDKNLFLRRNSISVTFMFLI